MDRPPAINCGHIFFVARTWRIIFNWSGYISCLYSTTRYVWVLFSRMLLMCQNKTYEYQSTYLKSKNFDLRMVGKENFRVSVKNSAQDRRKSKVDERNNIRHTSDKDVHLGETFCSACTLGKKVCVFNVYIY